MIVDLKLICSLLMVGFMLVDWMPIIHSYLDGSGLVGLVYGLTGSILSHFVLNFQAVKTEGCPGVQFRL